MPSFPVLHAAASRQDAWVACSEADESPARFGVVQGALLDFRPAGLPPPDWCIIVNPTGPDDPEVEEVELNACFGPGRQDATGRDDGPGVRRLPRAGQARAV